MNICVLLFLILCGFIVGLCWAVVLLSCLILFIGNKYIADGDKVDHQSLLLSIKQVENQKMLIIRTINLLVSAWLILNKMYSHFIQNWWFKFTNFEKES